MAFEVPEDMGDNFEPDVDGTNRSDEEDMGIVIIPGINDLPEFANTEARKLHKDNLRNEKKIEKLSDSIYDMKDRVKTMKEHFKNVQQEVEHTNALQNAKKSEIQTELHLKELTSRALGRTQLDSKNLQSAIQFVQEQLNTVQSLIYKANEKMDEFKMQMNWNQEELEQWAVASKQKEEDYLALEKYRRADEFKIKELNLELIVITKQYLAQKKKLEDESSDTQAKQMELDRIATEFKNAHLERQEMVERWQETIAEMKKRDKEINDLGERFAHAKAERTKKEIQFNLKNKRLLAQQNENKEVEMRSETLSRIVLRKREDMMSGQLKLDEFRGELEAIKNELTTAAEGLITKRTQNSFKQQAVEEKRVQLERERQKFQLIKSKIDTAESNANKAELNAKLAEDALNQHEKDLHAEALRVKNLKERSIKELQAVHELKMEEARLRSEISGTKSISRNLESQLNQLDKESARQQELLYNAEFQIQQIERKIARGMGERSDEEKLNLKNQIEALEKTLEDGREKRKMLNTQSRKLNNELVAFRQKKEDLGEKLTVLVENLGEKELENRMIEEEIRKDNRELEDMSVLK